MGNYKARRPGFLSSWQIRVAELTFAGFSDKEIVKDIWPNEPEEKFKALQQRMKRARNDPKFQEYYRSLVSEWSIHNVGKALNRLAQQIDSDKEWLANKAANDVIQQSKLLISGSDDNSVVIKVEGMPELGVPDE